MSDSDRQFDLKAALADKAAMADAAIAQVMDSHNDIHRDLKVAMEYSLKSPGKRLRAVMCLWACEVVAGSVNDAAKLAAVAVEMVHTYSLIHDDLPAMDDDDFRRGQPSCHKAFGEATAILAGDGLLTLAFEILADGVADKSMAAKMISVLAKAAGPAGMIAGQMADMKNTDSQGTVDVLEYIHTNKTAKMFAAAVVAGAIAGGASDKQISGFEQYGLNVGLGFQIADDILDVTESSQQLGKTAGKDAQQGKVTYPAVVGLDESKRLGKMYADKAVESLSAFGAEADVLRLLANELLARTK